MLSELYQGRFIHTLAYAFSNLTDFSYLPCNIFLRNGVEWHKLRQNLTSLLKMKTVHSYWPRQLAVAREFASSISSKTNPDGVVENFLPHAFLYSLEGV